MAGEREVTIEDDTEIAGSVRRSEYRSLEGDGGRK